MASALIEVRIWGHQVGAVARDDAVGAYVFEYAPAWRRRGIELAPLLMPITGTQSKFVFPTLSEPAFKRLPGMLADALPDDFGNALIDAWMARQGVDKHQVTTLDRLAYMGKRGVGALEFRPAKGAHRESHQPLHMQQLVETARQLIHGDLSDDAQAQSALANIIRVGTSAGGARAKAVVAWNPETDELRSGQFDVAEGFEHWLLKFDGVGKDLELGTGANYGRIEFAYHRMALAAGIDMHACRLLEENGRAHFMTKRFDRDGNRKHHVQSLCAMQHLDYKQRGTHAYETLFLVAERLGLDDLARAQLFLRMAFNVMARNCDDHTKNFAFLLREGHSWELTPAFDVTHAYNPDGEWTYQHLMSVNGKFDDIRRADLTAAGDRFSVPRISTLLDQVMDAVARWAEFATEAALPAREADKVAADHRLLIA